MKVCPKCGTRCENCIIICPSCRYDLTNVKKIYRNIKYPNDYPKKPLIIIEKKEELEDIK